MGTGFIILKHKRKCFKNIGCMGGGIWGEGGMRQKTGGVMSRIVRRAGGGGGGECIRCADLDHTGHI